MVLKLHAAHRVKYNADPSHKLDRELYNTLAVLNDPGTDQSHKDDARDYVHAVENGAAHYLTVFNLDRDITVQTNAGEAFNTYFYKLEADVDKLNRRNEELENRNQIEELNKIRPLLDAELKKLDALEHIEAFALRKFASISEKLADSPDFSHNNIDHEDLEACNTLADHFLKEIKKITGSSTAEEVTPLTKEQLNNYVAPSTDKKATSVFPESRPSLKAI